VSLVDNYGLETLRRELVQSPCLKQSLICCDGSFCKLDNRFPQNITKTDRSAWPDALCLPPCSISTVQSGRWCLACAAACFASSMLLTITNDFVASGWSFLGSSRDRSEIKTAVLPAPVGIDTPIREAPEQCASRHALRQCSW
jgi:hypothetical protein